MLCYENQLHLNPGKTLLNLPILASLCVVYNTQLTVYRQANKCHNPGSLGVQDPTGSWEKSWDKECAPSCTKPRHENHRAWFISNTEGNKCGGLLVYIWGGTVSLFELHLTFCLYHSLQYSCKKFLIQHFCSLNGVQLCLFVTHHMVLSVKSSMARNFT